MKRFILVLVVLLMVPAFAFAEPVLTCDPQSWSNPDGTTGRPTIYRVRLGPIAEWAEAPANAEGAAWFPLNVWPAGNYPSCEIQAGGMVAVTDTTTGIRTTAFIWGPSAPFVFEKLIGSTPENVQVVDAPF